VEMVSNENKKKFKMLEEEMNGFKEKLEKIYEKDRIRQN
jgi:hypothetical protein